MDGIEERDKQKQESTDKFPCPSCGGNMVFDPDTQQLSCSYCENKIDIANTTGDIKEYDIDSVNVDDRQNWGNEKRVIKCESCGAETVLDTNITAQFCAFCGSSHVVKNDKNAGIVPESLVPFRINEQHANELFKKWIGKRFFAPKALKSSHRNDRIKGVYIPHWTYDSDTYSTYTAEGGTYYYDTEIEWVEEDGKRKQVTKQVRKIRWWPTSGTYAKYYDDVIVNASAEVNGKIIKKLEPYDLGALVHYKPEYLSGFLAERYSIDFKEGWLTAKNIMSRGIEDGVKHQIDADEIRNLRIRTSYDNVKFKHILLPVWISAYTYNNKVYRYMVNGQTGEVQGESPISIWKILGLILLVAVVAGGLFLLSRSGHKA